MTDFVDPKMLSSAQRRALKLIADHKLYRRLGGYGRAPASVSLDIVASLKGLGLARTETTGPQPHPVLTGKGNNILAVMRQRAEMRGRA